MGDGTKENPFTYEDIIMRIAQTTDFSGKVFQYCLNLSGFNLKGANLEKADLNSVDLTGAYLENVRISDDTNLYNVSWGDYKLGEEIDGEKTGGDVRIKSFNLTLPIYRRLKIWYTQNGISDVAGRFYYREKEVARKVAPRKRDKIAGWFSWAIFGHGEGWKRILFWILGFVLVFGCIYFSLSQMDIRILGTLKPNGLLDCLYYSSVSFIAIGYGSWVTESTGLVKGLGVCETFLGFFMMTLLLVTFVRKWAR
jgi:hypothetical protein